MDDEKKDISVISLDGSVEYVSFEKAIEYMVEGMRRENKFSVDHLGLSSQNRKAYNGSKSN